MSNKCQNKYGDTGLIIAAANDHEDVVRLLVENGASINYQNALGDTALHAAARLREGVIVTLLLEKEASILPNGNGRTPCMKQ